MTRRNPSELIHLEPAGPGVFAAPQALLYRPLSSRAVFGGQVIAQALHAASRTVSDFQVHSLHCYFLLPGRTSENISYAVEALRDGQNFCARKVAARQNGQVIFVLIAQFSKFVSLGLRFSAPAPAVPKPADLISLAEFLAEVGLSPGARARAERGLRSPVPVEQRFAHPAFLRGDKSRRAEAVEYFEGGKNGGDGEIRDPPRRMFWLRVTTEIEEGWLHTIVFSLISDWPVLNTALEPLGHSLADRLTFIASLDHSIWFHRPGLRVDSWLLFDLTCQQASSERTLVLGHIWNEESELMATISQEGLIRIKPSKL